jgi:hypothetical protein
MTVIEGTNMTDEEWRRELRTPGPRTTALPPELAAMTWSCLDDPDAQFAALSAEGRAIAERVRAAVAGEPRPPR